MALEEDVVTAAGVVLATEEVVKAYFIEGSYGGIGGDVSTHTDARTLGAGNHNGGVPTDPATVLALCGFIAGEVGFFVNINSVDVRGG